MKVVQCYIGTVNGGIGINWEYPDIPEELFGQFLAELKLAAGFKQPRLVRLENNNEDGTKPRWTRMRFAAEDCALFLQGRLGLAIRRIQAFLTSAETRRTYKVKFQVETSLD